MRFNTILPFTYTHHFIYMLPIIFMHRITKFVSYLQIHYCYRVNELAFDLSSTTLRTDRWQRKSTIWTIWLSVKHLNENHCVRRWVHWVRQIEFWSGKENWKRTNVINFTLFLNSNDVGKGNIFAGRVFKSLQWSYSSLSFIHRNLLSHMIWSTFVWRVIAETRYIL